MISLYKIDQQGTSKCHTKSLTQLDVVFFQVLCNDQELKIIQQSEKKNQMTVSEGRYRFYAVDLSKPETDLIPCYRNLTKVSYISPPGSLPIAIIRTCTILKLR